jgi:hypothetical protein
MWAALCLAGAPATVPHVDKPRLVVKDLSVAGGMDESIARAMSQAMTAAVGRAGLFTVISSREIETLVGVERQKQLLGCSEDSTTCLSELAGAINARFVLGGTLAKLGDAYQLTLQTVDSERAQPVGRAVRIASSLSALQDQLPWAVAEATATPAPRAPSRAPAIALWIGGGALLLGGGLAGFDALSRERALNDELTRGNTMPDALRPLSTYRNEASSASLEKTIALSCMIAGAAAVIVGFIVMPGDNGGPKIAVVPAGNGLGLAGNF